MIIKNNIPNQLEIFNEKEKIGIKARSIARVNKRNEKFIKLTQGISGDN